LLSLIAPRDRADSQAISAVLFLQKAAFLFAFTTAEDTKQAIKAFDGYPMRLPESFSLWRMEGTGIV
jgi:hypothetical protein